MKDIELKVGSGFILWEDNKIKSEFILASLDKILILIKEKKSPSVSMLDFLNNIKKDRFKIRINGPSILVNICINHIYMLYGEDICYLGDDVIDEDEFSLDFLTKENKLKLIEIGRDLDFFNDYILSILKDVSFSLNQISGMGIRLVRSVEVLNAQVVKEINEAYTYLNEFKSNLTKKINEYDQKVNIAIYGATGSGKSTYLNSLLGEHYLPISSIRSCTGVLTYVYYNSHDTFFDVYSKNGSHNRFSNLSLLHKYIDISSEVDKSEIDHIELYLPLDILKFITFIDVPGSRDGDVDRQNQFESILNKIDGFIYTIPLERGTNDFNQDLESNEAVIFS